MSQKTSPATGKIYGLKKVCAIWEVPRSSIYFRKKALIKSSLKKRRGPKPKISDCEVLERIKEDIKISPFHGEGHKKIHARVRRQGTPIGKDRVLRIMGENNLLSPYRQPQGEPNLHDGTIITNEPNKMWATDGIRIDTVEDGMVWGFFLIEHWNAECLGWHVCKKGNAQAALEPLKQGVKKIYGSMNSQIGHGLKIREDHGSQYTSEQYRNQLKYWGIKISYSFIQEPETNGVVERFNRTLKEQIIHGRILKNLAEVREVISQFIEKYNEHWILEKLGYLSPIEARKVYENSAA